MTRIEPLIDWRREQSMIFPHDLLRPWRWVFGAPGVSRLFAEFEQLVRQRVGKAKRDKDDHLLLLPVWKPIAQISTTLRGLKNRAPGAFIGASYRKFCLQGKPADR